MSKRFRVVKATIFMSIILMSVFAVIAPSASAGIFNKQSGLVNASQAVNLVYTSGSLKEPVEIKGEPNVLKINVTYTFSVGGGLLSWLLSRYTRLGYGGQQISVVLNILDYPEEWSVVTLDDKNIDFIILENGQSSISKEVVMTVTVNENAPAYEQGKIIIEVDVAGLNRLLFPNIPKFHDEKELYIIPQYNGVVDPKIVGSISKHIGPMDTVTFPIEVENNGNERSKVYFEIENIPKGWQAIVAPSTILEVGEKKTVELAIQPPNTLGYHYDREQFEVKITPARATVTSGTEQLYGRTEKVEVAVESQGFSFIGIEILLIPLIIIIALILALYHFVLKDKLKLRK
jgi:hypothetical protein